MQTEAWGSFQWQHKTAWTQTLQNCSLGPPRKEVAEGPFPPGLALLPGFFWSGSNFSRGNVDFQARRVSVASCSVCASNAKQEQLVAHNNMHCVSEQHNKQFARQPRDTRTILYHGEERKELKNMWWPKPKGASVYYPFISLRLLL